MTRLVAGFTNSYIIKKMISSLDHRCFGAWGHTLNGNEVRGGQGLRAIEYHWVGDEKAMLCSLCNSKEAIPKKNVKLRIFNEITHFRNCLQRSYFRC